MKSLVLFNNKGGVGKTTLTYNLAHMLARQGRRVILVDYDPQCNLTALALDEDTLKSLWEQPSDGDTVATCLELVRLGKGDLHEPDLYELADDLLLLPGDIALSRFESKLAKAWAEVLSSEADAALHVTTALDRLAVRAASQYSADLIMFDIGPSLGALNRAVLLASDAVVIPLAPDLFSLRGLQNVGEALDEWRDEWETARIKLQQRARRRGEPAPDAPERHMQPIGYILQQQVHYGDEPIRASRQWLERIAPAYSKYIMHKGSDTRNLRGDQDPHCLGSLRHYASLVPIARAARKPIFELKHADGIVGSQLQTVVRARKELEALAHNIGARLDALGVIPSRKA